MVRTAERWHREAVAGSECTVEAWQALAYPVSGPTWNGHRDGRTDARRGDFGYLGPDDAVREARRETRAEALDADAVVLQTPSGSDCTG